MKTKFIILAAVCAALLLSTTASAQVWFNGTNRGVSYTNTNTGASNNVVVDNGGGFTNQNDGRVATAVLNDGGYINNRERFEERNILLYYWRPAGRITDMTLNGGTLDNGGIITTLNYYAGTYNIKPGEVNRNGVSTPGIFGTVDTLNVFGISLGTNWGNVGTANVKANAMLENIGGNTVGTANVEGGTFINRDGSTVGTANVNNGTFVNRDYGRVNNATLTNGFFSNDYHSSLGNAVINGGFFENKGDSTIANLTQNAGTVNNQGSIDAMVYWGGKYINKSNGNTGSIGTLTLNVTSAPLDIDWRTNVGTLNVNVYNGGNFTNNSGEKIAIAQQFGGQLRNAGTIDDMLYVSGNYNGQNGWVGQMTLDGDTAQSSSGNWGVIENLAFTANGVATFTARANGSLSGINANYVDFTNADIVFNMNNVARDFDAYWAVDFLDSLGFWGTYSGGFFLADLFGATGFDSVDALSSIGVNWGADSFSIFNGGVLGKGWDINFDTGYVSYSDVPEPATLLILGLAGLGGLGYRKLRRKP